VISTSYNRFRIIGRAAHSNLAKLAQISRECGAEKIGIPDRQAFLAERAGDIFPAGTAFFFGTGGNCELAMDEQADLILMAIPSVDGVLPIMAAIGAHRTIILASKEVLVVAGKFAIGEAKLRGAKILPVDSEHSAIFQCLVGGENSVKRVILTASGGPYPCAAGGSHGGGCAASPDVVNGEKNYGRFRHHGQ
jgi:1-deoxy-D-xylulose-5-phosphate reductoisomerase